MKTWTNEEVAVLVENYNKVSNEEIASLLPNKTQSAIYKKAYNMGLRRTKEIVSLNRKLSKKGANNPLWKGGVAKSAKGYRLIKMPEHPRADKKGYVFEHIVVFENECGVLVPNNCCIHHLNGIKDDNRIENLCMMAHSAHTVFHHTGAKRNEQTKQLIRERKKKHE